MAFLIFVVLFWTPAVLLLIFALFSFKFKKLRKVLLVLSLISFSIPLVLVLTTRVSQKIAENDLVGVYKGTDEFSNSITLIITENEAFSLLIDNCNQYNLQGRWQYMKEYDDFLFYADSQRISLYENHRGDKLLTIDIVNDCCNLKEVKMKKE